MMGTENYDLPLVDGTASAKVPRDLNALARAVDQVIKSEAKKKTDQSKLLATFYQKLMKKESVKIVSQGDSLTYGHDTTSADKRQPNPIPADDGTPHFYERASKTYPEALQEYLRFVYSNDSVVINKGYSGDWVDASLQHWNHDEKADLVFLMLGTNDANLNASYIPSDVRGNIQRYLDDYRRLIDRYTKWGTAVILLTSPRLLAEETINGLYIEPFRHAVKVLGKEAGIPVVDTEIFMNGCDASYYSDSVHFNAKGYTYFASRLVSLLIGFGESGKVAVKAGDVLSVRRTRDNFVSKDVLFTEDPNSYGPSENSVNQGLLAALEQNSRMHFGFEALEDNLILIPVYSVENSGSLKTNLDFGNEQGSTPLLSATHNQLPRGQKPTSQIVSSVVTANASAYDGSIGIEENDRYLHISNKGWHTISLENSSSSGNVYFNGFVILSFEDFIQRQLTRPKNCMPIIRGGNVLGNHAYSKQLGKYVLDPKRRMVHVSIDVQCVIDNTIDGYVTIPLGTPHLTTADLSYSVAISYANNILPGKGMLYGWLPPETNEIILQTPNDNGLMDIIEGASLRGKSIRFVATVSYFY